MLQLLEDENPSTESIHHGSCMMCFLEENVMELLNDLLSLKNSVGVQVTFVAARMFALKLDM